MLFWEPKTLWQRTLGLVPWYYCVAFYAGIIGLFWLYWWFILYQPLLITTDVLQQQLYSLQQSTIVSDKGSVLFTQEARVLSILARQNIATSLDMLTLIHNSGGIVLQESTRKIERGVGYVCQDVDLVLQATYQQITQLSASLEQLSNVIIKDFKLDNPCEGKVRGAFTVRIITLSKGLV